MRTVAILLTMLALTLPGAVHAQDGEDPEGDRGRIVRFLENQLSDGARTVTIRGFRGALTSTAEMDLLTIADDEGVWLTLENAQLSWSRAALLRGALQVDRLTAERLEFTRAPVIEGGPDLPSAEAQPFSLPDLPVSIAIDEVAIDRVSLGEDLVGTAVELSVAGSARLAGGDGTADLDIRRLDGPRGVFDLDAAYSNQTRELTLSLLVEEDEGGLVATLLDLPDAPSIRLSVEGTGPIDDFTAEITLASDGQPRLTGEVQTTQQQETEERSIRAELGGDITPLILPAYREFFGPDVALSTQLRLMPDGGVELDTLTLSAAALTLDGTLSLAAGGRPRAFDLTGRIADPAGGGPVLLPVSGGEVAVDTVDLELSYDAEAGDSYTARIDVAALDLGPTRFESFSLDASGQIAQGPQGIAVSSPIAIEVAGMSHDDPALAEALGDSADLTAQLSWLQGAPLILSDLDVAAGDLSLQGMLALLFGDNRLSLTTNLAAEADDLSRFAAAAGQPLSGSLNAQVSGEADLLSGAFDMVLSGTGTDLTLADAVPPELLAGDTTLTVSAVRDQTGLTLRELTLEGSQLSLDADGRVSSDGTTLQAEARLADVGLFSDMLSGAVTTSLVVTQGSDEGAPLNVTANATSDFGLAADITGEVDPQTGGFEVVLTGTGTDLDFVPGVPPELLAGETNLTVSAVRNDAGLVLRELTLDGQQVSLNGEGRLGDDGAEFSAQARLADVGLFTDVVSGAVSADVDVTQGPEENAPFSVTATATSDFGITAEITGEVDPQTQGFDLVLTGTGTDLDFVPGAPPELLAGETTLTVSALRDETGLVLRELTLNGRELSLSGEGRLGDDGAVFSAEARLANVGLFTDALSGSVSGTANVTRGPGGDAPYRIVADVSSAAGITASLSGSARPSEGTIDMTATGQLPLALANRALAPRSINGTLGFDLAIRGAPNLENLSGSFRTDGARVSLPLLQTSIESVTASGQISNGRVSFDAGGILGTGGSINANGAVTLSAPGLPAQISVTGQNLRLVDPTLYSALIERADITINGALAGSFNVAGNVALGETELRVPETGLGGSAPIPPIRHVNETPAERRTRIAAGLGPAADPTGGGSGRIGLDLTVSAPSRVFIRGRGLDAELGGTLTLRGTTADVIPSGQFDLIRGRLSILGTRLDLTDGSATLQGSFDPYIRLLATSRSGGYTIGVNVIGPISAPEIRFTSEPLLPEDEVLAQLLFGRSVSALSPVQLLQMADAAAALAGGSSRSGIFATLREGLGLDDLDLQTDSEGNAAVRAGRYLSDNIYTDLTVGGDGDTDLSLNIDLTPNITARGTFSSDGSSRLGVFYERDY